MPTQAKAKGTPPKPKGNPTRDQVSIWFSKKESDLITNYCHDNALTKTDFLRGLVREFFSQNPPDQKSA